MFDLNLPETFDTALDGMDVVIHLAALDFQACEKNPELAQKLNVEAVKLLLQSVQKQKVEHIIYLSTFHVYGMTEGIITEKTHPDPQNTYALTHLKAEQEIIDFQSPVRKSIIRLSNSFGRPLLPSPSAQSLVINDFCKQAVKTRKIRIQSSGHQLRDFVSTDELFSFLNFLIGKKNLSTEIYNLGSGKTVSLLEMAHLIQKICIEKFNYPVTIEQLGDQPTVESQKNFVYSCEKVKSLGYEACESVEEGLFRFLEELFHEKND